MEPISETNYLNELLLLICKNYVDPNITYYTNLSLRRKELDSTHICEMTRQT